MKQLEGVKFAYANAERNCGLKEGDRVKILRKAATYEWGWCNNWSAKMDDAVGKFGIVLKVSDSGSGVTVQLCPEDTVTSIYSFPFFVLEKTEEEDYNEHQKQFMQNHYVGSAVRIERASYKGERGWKSGWCVAMNDCVGKVGIIRSYGDYGVKVQFESGTMFDFPFFVLKKIEGVDIALEPFQMVLVRDSESCAWTASLFSHYSDTDPNRKYVTINHAKWMYCIPYEGNEGFLGKGGSNGN